MSKKIAYDPVFCALATTYCLTNANQLNGAEEAWNKLCKHVDDRTKRLIADAVQPYKDSLESKARLTREMDVIMNGEEGAAQQASLCDIVMQLKNEWPRKKDEN